MKLLLFWFPALAGLQPALAGCVHEAGLLIVAGAGPPVVGEIAGGYRLAGDMQLAPGHPARYPASYATPPAEHREDGAGFLLPFGRRPSLLEASCPA